MKAGKSSQRQPKAGRNDKLRREANGGVGGGEKGSRSSKKVKEVKQMEKRGRGRRQWPEKQWKEVKAVTSNEKKGKDQTSS